MEIKYLFLIIVALINFTVGTSLIFKNKNSIINLSFAMVFYSAALWSFSMAMFINQADMDIATTWAKIYYFASAIIPFVFLIFSNSYLYSYFKINDLKILYLLIPVLAITFIIFHPTFFIEKAIHYNWGNDANVKLAGHLIFTGYFFSYVIFAFKILINKYNISEGANKNILFSLLITSALSYLFGITFDLILPLFGNYKLIWAGPYFTVIVLTYMSYLIFYKPSKV